MEKTKFSITAKAANYVAAKRKALLEDMENVNVNERRLKAFAKYLENNVPRKILNRCKVEFSQYGRWMDANISPKFGEQFTEHDTLVITAWGAESDKWEFNKELMGHSGNWNHEMKRSYNNWPSQGGSYTICFRATAEIDGCKMVKSVETVEKVVYKLDCK